MRYRFLLALALLLLLGGVGPAGAQKRKLSDAELDKVIASGASTQLVHNVLSFQFQLPVGRRHTVDGSGTVQVQTAEAPTITVNNTGTLTFSDNAQQNLRSFINITAVNSKVQVLVNLNVNINSTVATLTQTNLSGSGKP